MNWPQNTFWFSFDFTSTWSFNAIGSVLASFINKATQMRPKRALIFGFSNDNNLGQIKIQRCPIKMRYFH